MKRAAITTQEADLEKRFVTVTASDWGQGKTDMALELVDGLQARGYNVGGFCVRRVYSPVGAGFATTALEGIILRTGECVRLARHDYTDDDAVDFRRARHDGLRVGLEGIFHINQTATSKLLAAALDDAADPNVDAFILDEVGPLLFRSRHLKRRREKRSLPFYELALQVVDCPKAFTCVVFSDPDMQSEQALGVRKHIQAHPSRVHDRASNWRLTPDNFRVLAAQILQETPRRRRR